MELIASLTGLLRNLIIILLILIIIFAFTVKFHQEYELLCTGLDGANGEIKKFRKSRYQLVKDMMSTFGQYADSDTLGRLQKMMKAYPKLKSSKAEAEWERKWSPIMARFIKQVTANVPQMMATPFSIAKKSFSTNEKNLSFHREMLASVKADMEAFQSSKIKMFFANLMDTFMNFSKESHERVIQYEQEKAEHEEQAAAEKKRIEEQKKEQITTLHGADTGDDDLFISSLDELDETEPLDSEFAASIAEQPEQLRRRDDMHKAARRNAKEAERVAQRNDNAHNESKTNRRGAKRNNDRRYDDARRNTGSSRRSENGTRSEPSGWDDDLSAFD